MVSNIIPPDPNKGPEDSRDPTAQEVQERVVQFLKGRRDGMFTLEDRYNITITYEKNSHLFFEVEDTHGEEQNAAQNGRRGDWLFDFECGKSVPKVATFTPTDTELMEEYALIQAPLTWQVIFDALSSSPIVSSFDELLSFAYPRSNAHSDFKVSVSDIEQVALRHTNPRAFFPQHIPDTPLPSFHWEFACSLLAVPVRHFSTDSLGQTMGPSTIIKDADKPLLNLLSDLERSHIETITSINDGSAFYILVGLELHSGDPVELGERYTISEIKSFSLAPQAFISRA
jgi:hypothetical protein